MRVISSSQCDITFNALETILRMLKVCFNAVFEYFRWNYFVISKEKSNNKKHFAHIILIWEIQLLKFLRKLIYPISTYFGTKDDFVDFCFVAILYF